MKFNMAIVKSVKADLAAGKITISFTIGTDEKKAAEELAFFRRQGCRRSNFGCFTSLTDLLIEVKDEDEKKP